LDDDGESARLALARQRQERPRRDAAGAAHLFFHPAFDFDRRLAEFPVLLVPLAERTFPFEVVVAVRRHAPQRQDRTLQWTALGDVAQGRRQAVLPVAAEVEEHRDVADPGHREAKLDGLARRRDDVEDGVDRGVKRAVEERLHGSDLAVERAVQRFQFQKRLLAALRDGVRVADQPWREFDFQILGRGVRERRFGWRGFARADVEGEARGELVWMRAGLRLGIAAFVGDAGFEEREAEGDRFGIDRRVLFRRRAWRAATRDRRELAPQTVSPRGTSTR
jgi:hypothetical protein